MPAQNEVSLRITAEDDASRVLQGAVRDLDRLQREVNETAKSFRSVDKSSTELNEALRDVTRSTRTYRDASGRLRDEMGKFVREGGRGVNVMVDLGSALDQVAQGLRRAGDFGARQLRAFVQSGSRLEQLRTSYTSLFGSIEAADSAIAKLRAAAQDPGLTFDVAARGAQRFASLGISIDESIQLMRGLANSAALSGTSLDQLDEGARQLFQVLARGKIEQEDLNSLTERFGTIARVVRKEYGATADDINKNLEQAGKTVRDFAREITALEGAPRASAETLANAMSNLNNALEEVRSEIGTELIPVVKQITQFLVDLLQAWNRLDDRQQRMVIDLGILTTALALVGSTVLSVATNVGILAVAFGGAGGLTATAGAAAAAVGGLGATLGTIGLVAGGTVAVVGGIGGLMAELEEQSKLAGDGVRGVIDSVTIRDYEKLEEAVGKLNAGLIRLRINGRGLFDDITSDLTPEEIRKRIDAANTIAGLDPLNFQDLLTSAITPDTKEVDDRLREVRRLLAPLRRDFENLGNTAEEALNKARALLQPRPFFDAFAAIESGERLISLDVEGLGAGERSRAVQQFLAERRRARAAVTREARGPFFRPTVTARDVQERFQPTIPQILPQDIAEQRRFVREAVDVVNRAGSERLRRYWRDAYASVTGYAKGFRGSVVSGLGDMLAEVKRVSNISTTVRRLQFEEEVGAATRQFEALGDLNNLRIQSEISEKERLQRLRGYQNDVTNAIFATAGALSNVSDAFRTMAEVAGDSGSSILDVLSKIAQLASVAASAVGGIRQVQAGSQSGAATGTERALDIASGIANIASAFVGLGRIFHNPSNDFIAELAGYRAGGRGLPTGTIRAIQRQNARDFSDSFARGVTRGANASPQPAQPSGSQLVLQLNLNDRALQQVATRLTVMADSGRTSIGRR